MRRLSKCLNFWLEISGTHPKIRHRSRWRTQGRYLSSQALFVGRTQEILWTVSHPKLFYGELWHTKMPDRDVICPNYGRCRNNHAPLLSEYITHEGYAVFLERIFEAHHNYHTYVSYTFRTDQALFWRIHCSSTSSSPLRLLKKSRLEVPEPV